MDDFDKDGEDVRLLVWWNAGVEHCDLIKNIEALLDRPKKSQHKFYYCKRCTYWFNPKIKFDKLESSHFFISEIASPKRKHMTFINEHKHRKIKNITADIECFVVDVTTNNCKYVIVIHILIIVGYIWQSNFK